MKKTQVKKIKLLFVFILSAVAFTGCWDKAEPEERGFVTALGIDKVGGKFQISTEIPELSIFEESGGGEEKKESGEESGNKYVEVCDGKTIWSAVKTIDGKTERHLDFGQIKLCVLGEEILKDEKMTKQAIDALERSKDIWRKVFVCAAKGKAEDILKGYSGDRKTAGFFAAAFFNNNKSTTDIAFKKTLQEALADLSRSEETVLPVMEIEQGEISFNMAAVIKDYKLKGFCGDEIIRGYNIVKEDIMETDIKTDFNGTEVPLKVNKKSTDIKFTEDNDKVKCTISVEIEGNVEEYGKGDVPVSELEKAYNKRISEMIRNSFLYFREEMKTDVMQLGEYCRKKNNSIYKHFGEEDIFKNMELFESVNVKIKGTGTIN